MIRYHGGPITPNGAAIRAWRDGHAMISFANQQQVDLAFEVAGEVVIDNGAFSHWKAGKGSIPIGEYYDFINKWRFHPAFGWCVIPDLIDGDEEKNRILVESWNLPEAISVPVWHMHESVEYLEWLIDKFPRVAIGSSGDFSNPGTSRWWNRIAEAMEVACTDGMPLVKLHGLRQMDPEIFSVVPYSSVDSCGLARNIGIDAKWDSDRYAPKSKETRALIYRENMAFHASSRRFPGAGIQRNLELLG